MFSMQNLKNEFQEFVEGTNSLLNIFDKKLGKSVTHFFRISDKILSVKNKHDVAKHDSAQKQNEKVNQNLYLSTLSLTVSTVGTMFYPSLVLLSASLLTYIAVPIWREGYRVLKEKRRFEMIHIDALVLPVALVTGNFIAASLAYLLIFCSKKLHLKTENHSYNSLIEAFEQKVSFVSILVSDNTELVIPLEKLEKEDIVIVCPGEVIPVDGIIVDGYASIDQRFLTGESQPIEKSMGERVLASSVVLQGKIQIKIEDAGKETVAAQIGEILRKTVDYKTSTQLKAKKLGDKSSKPILFLSAMAFFMKGANSTLAVLCTPVVSSMRLSAPIGILNFLHIASQNGILIKDGRALEQLNNVDTVIFDKTGTLTLEQPQITNIYSIKLSENELLKFAAAAEFKQVHPIAKAILEEANQRELTLPNIDKCKYEVGYGISVVVEGKMVQVGSENYMNISGIKLPSSVCAIRERCKVNGHSLVYISIDGNLEGTIELEETIRPEVNTIIDKLHARNIKTYIISGDHDIPTRILAEKLNIDNYFAAVLPQNKAELVSELQKSGSTVCFIGDGINDSIALKKANVSISLCGASQVAIDTAQIVFVNESLEQLIPLLDMAKRYAKNIQHIINSSVVPSFICVGGVFLLNFRVFAAISLYFISIAWGLTVAMSPLWINQLEEIEDSENTT